MLGAVSADEGSCSPTESGANQRQPVAGGTCPGALSARQQRHARDPEEQTRNHETVRRPPLTPGGKEHHPERSGAHVERCLPGRDPLFHPSQHTMAADEEEPTRKRRGQPL